MCGGYQKARTGRLAKARGHGAPPLVEIGHCRALDRVLGHYGQHLWARGYFCATVGAVDEKAVMTYIESQKWDQDDEGFKVTAPTEP